MLQKATTGQAQDTQRLIRALLVGHSKTGKTEGAATFAGQKFFLGLTPRTRATVGHRTDCTVLEISEAAPKKVSDRRKDPKTGRTVTQELLTVENPTGWTDLLKASEELTVLAKSSKPFPYSTVVLDDLTAAGEMAMNYVLRIKGLEGISSPTLLGGVPAQNHYAAQARQLRSLIPLSLLFLPCHFIMCAHLHTYEEYDIKGNPTNSKDLPKAYGQIRTEIPSWFDEVYRTYTRPGIGPTDPQEFFWQAQGLSFLGSTINKQNRLWTGSSFKVNLTEQLFGFEKILDMDKKQRKGTVSHGRTI